MSSTTVLISIAVLVVSLLAVSLFTKRQMFGPHVTVRQTREFAALVSGVLLVSSVLYLVVPESWDEPLWINFHVGVSLLW